MLRISKLTDYALLIMSQMAKTPDDILSATRLAEILHLSVPTVSKVLKILSEASLLNSVRGAEGGYRLARLAKEITVADVIMAMEGGITMTECCETINHCAIDSICTMKENWKKINKLVYGLLDRFTLTDMLLPIEVTDG